MLNFSAGMIYGPLTKLKGYKIIPYLDTMTAFMAAHDLMALPEGEYNIEGRDVVLHVLRCEPRDAVKAQFETHKIYGDVHIVLKGVERIQTVRHEFLVPVADYDKKKDVHFFTATQDISDIIVGEQEFAYFAAGESHKPMCFVRPVTTPIAKFVFKVRQL